MESGIGTVVVVDDDESQRILLGRWLEDAGHFVETFSDGASCLRGLPRTLADVVCLDVRMPGIDGLETLEKIRAHHPRLPVIMLTSDDSVDPVVTAIRLGAFEYLRKPVDRQKLLTTVRNAVSRSRMERRLVELEQEVEGREEFPEMLGRSAAMRGLFRQMSRVAPTDASVLIRGESGTGKELVARALHHASGRRSAPFVAVNCAAIPESLQESELFGHEKGAFTGALRRQPGRFEQADGGTLFLDEVGELAPGLQAKLLRAIQEQRFFRVGGAEEIHSDFRLITATHRDLVQEVREGVFREDLYFRIAVLELEVPPLRDRGSDIALLATTFARDLGLSARETPSQITREALEVLSTHRWPGNVRELQNAIHRAVVMAEGGFIDLDDLPGSVRNPSPAGVDSIARAAGRGVPTGPAAGAPPTAANSLGEDGIWTDGVPDQPLSESEAQLIEAMVHRHGGNLSVVARILDISRTTLYRKMEAYGVARPGS